MPGTRSMASSALRSLLGEGPHWGFGFKDSGQITCAVGSGIQRKPKCRLALRRRGNFRLSGLRASLFSKGKGRKRRGGGTIAVVANVGFASDAFSLGSWREGCEVTIQTKLTIIIIEIQRIIVITMTVITITIVRVPFRHERRIEDL